MNADEIIQEALLQELLNEIPGGSRADTDVSDAKQVIRTFSVLDSQNKRWRFTVMVFRPSSLGWYCDDLYADEDMSEI